MNVSMRFTIWYYKNMFVLSVFVVHFYGKDAKYMHCDQCVCLCPLAYVKKHTSKFRKIVCVARSSSDGSAMHYVLLLWMTSLANRPFIQSQRRRVCFVELARVAAPAKKSAVSDCILFWHWYRWRQIWYCCRQILIRRLTSWHYQWLWQTNRLSCVKAFCCDIFLFGAAGCQCTISYSMESAVPL